MTSLVFLVIATPVVLLVAACKRALTEQFNSAPGASGTRSANHFRGMTQTS